MDTLKTRILIKHKDGATIAYLYNREAFDLLKIPKQEYDNSQFIEIGQEIEYEEIRYRVDSINFKFEEKTFEMNHGYGINMYSPTEQADFNCQISVFVVNA